MLRLRSDEQLVALLRAGHDEAFSVIHDRYRQRLLAYAQQMLRSRQDAEDVLQDVFERAYLSLRRASDDRALTVRPWLYRIAHNRCIDQLRRPAPPSPESLLAFGPHAIDPVLEADRRDALRRLITDVGRLPAQQRSALLMRELGGVSYADVADTLGVSVPAVKSLLVRARVSLVQAGEARDTACEEIREELVTAQDARVRPTPRARRHMRDCPGCREFRGNLRGTRRQIFGLVPAIGPLGLLARLIGGGSPSGGAAAAWGGSAATGATGATGGGIIAATANLAGAAGHVATLVAATVVTAGGAAAIGTTADTPSHHHTARHARATKPGAPTRLAPVASAAVVSTPAVVATVVAPSAPSVPPTLGRPGPTVATVEVALKPAAAGSRHPRARVDVLSLSEALAPPDPGPGALTAVVAPGATTPADAAGKAAGTPTATQSETAMGSSASSSASSQTSAGSPTGTGSAAGSASTPSAVAGQSSGSGRTSSTTASSPSSSSTGTGSSSATSSQTSPRPPSSTGTGTASTAGSSTSGASTGTAAQPSTST